MADDINEKFEEKTVEFKDKAEEFKAKAEARNEANKEKWDETYNKGKDVAEISSYMDNKESERLENPFKTREKEIKSQEPKDSEVKDVPQMPTANGGEDKTDTDNK